MASLEVKTVWATSTPSDSSVYYRQNTNANDGEWILVHHDDNLVRYHSAVAVGFPVDALIDIKIVSEIADPYEYAEAILLAALRTGSEVSFNDTNNIYVQYHKVMQMGSVKKYTQLVYALSFEDMTIRPDDQLDIDNMTSAFNKVSIILAVDVLSQTAAMGDLFSTSYTAELLPE